MERGSNTAFISIEVIGVEPPPRKGIFPEVPKHLWGIPQSPHIPRLRPEKYEEEHAIT